MKKDKRIETIFVSPDPKTQFIMNFMNDLALAIHRDKLLNKHVNSFHKTLNSINLKHRKPKKINKFKR